MIRTVRAFLSYAADRKNRQIIISVRIIAVRIKRALVVGSSFRDMRVFQVRVKNDHFLTSLSMCEKFGNEYNNLISVYIKVQLIMSLADVSASV